MDKEQTIEHVEGDVVQETPPTEEQGNGDDNGQDNDEDSD